MFDSELPRHIERLPPAAGGRPSLARAVYKRLKQDISEFRMPPGQRYSEQELSDVLAVSRTPLRLALHILAHEGYLQHVLGHSCWQVRPLDLDYYEDLYDFRIDIEVLALRRLCAMPAATLSDNPALTDLRTTWNVAPAARMRDGAVLAELDEHFHRTLVATAGNREMTRTHNELTDRIRIIRRLDFLNPARIAVTYDEHRAILDAIAARQAGEAVRLLQAHIEASRVEIRKLTINHLTLARPAHADRPSRLTFGLPAASGA